MFLINKILGFKSVFFYSLFLVGINLGNAWNCSAQLCTGNLGNPVVNITFGAGTSVIAPALAPGITNYTYVNNVFPLDGMYTIENTTAGVGAGIWWPTSDHTGDPGGYMMVVNATLSPTDYFYQQTVNGLCPGTTYEFSAWIVNLLPFSDVSPPNIVFSILTTGGAVLGTYSTGQIPMNHINPQWIKYGLTFTTPPGVNQVVLKIRDISAGGGPANDLALDDITFRPCGPGMITSFSNTGSVTNMNACTTVNQQYNLTTQITGGFSNPSYQWQVNSGAGWTAIAGATTPSYQLNFQPVTAGVYSYRLVGAETANMNSANCQVFSNILTLTAITDPVISVSSPGPLCVQSAPYQIVESKNGYAGTGVFSGTGVSSSGLFSPSVSGAGTFTISYLFTGSTGCTYSSSQSITVSPNPVIQLSAPGTLCVESAPYQIVETKNGFDGTGRFSGTGVSSSGLFTPSVSGTFAITYLFTGANGCTYSSSQSITVSPKPVIQLSVPGTLCVESAPYQFVETKNGFVGTGQFSGPGISTSGLFSPSVSGTFALSYLFTGANGCTYSSSQNITVQPVPVATISMIGTLCLGSSPVQIKVNNNGFAGSGVFSGTGVSPSGLFNPALSGTGNFLINYAFKGMNGCTFSASQTVIVAPNPEVSLSSPGPLCVESAPFQIIENKNGFAGTGVFSGTGVSSSGLFSPLISGAGRFFLNYTFTGINGCIFSSIKSITVNPNPVISLSLPGALCVESAPFQIVETKNGFPGTGVFSGTGVSPSGLFSPSVSRPGTFAISYLFTGTNGCTYSSSQNIIVLPVPVADISQTGTLCIGSSPVQIQVNNNGYAGTGVFSGTGVSSSGLFNPAISGAGNFSINYLFTGIDGCTYSYVQGITVTENPVIALSVPGSLCAGSPPFQIVETKNGFSGNGSFSGPGISSTGLFSPSITGAGNFLISYIFKGLNGCVFSTARNIAVAPDPVISLSRPGPLCIGSMPYQIIETKNGFSGAGVFSGTGVSPEGLFNPSTTGSGTFPVSYVFTATNGCTFSTTQSIIVYPDPHITLKSQVYVAAGDHLYFNASVEGYGLRYKWMPESGLSNSALLNPMVSPLTDTRYELTVTTLAGCTSTAGIQVNILRKPIAPNTFTPNGDGINDTWEIANLIEYPNSSVEIFNRYGMKVFSSVGYSAPWNGTYKGQKLQDGVYYYIINPGKGAGTISGSISIIH